ncbi:MAG: hypothetical protein LBF16_14360 [Pseudomonadales bacterium]|jgi:hypothetical protein|nr:hypothetical protein [Pseudomonadales bacterium]
MKRAAAIICDKPDAQADSLPDPQESLAAELTPIAAQLHELQNRAVREYAPIVERIIRSGSRDVREIETTLDGLLDFACVPDGLKLFKALCRYYYFIDPASTAYYVQSYRELWDEGSEDEDEGQEMGKRRTLGRYDELIGNEEE